LVLPSFSLCSSSASRTLHMATEQRVDWALVNAKHILNTSISYTDHARLCDSIGQMIVSGELLLAKAATASDNTKDQLLRAAQICAEASLIALVYTNSNTTQRHLATTLFKTTDHYHTLPQACKQYFNDAATIADLWDRIDALKGISETQADQSLVNAMAAIERFSSQVGSIPTRLCGDCLPESCGGTIPFGQFGMRCLTYAVLTLLAALLLTQLVLCLALVGLPDDDQCYRALNSTAITFGTENATSEVTPDSKQAVVVNAKTTASNAAAALVSLVIHVIGAMSNHWRSVSFAGFVIAGGSLSSSIASIVNSHCDLERATAYVGFVVAFLGTLVSSLFIFADGRLKPDIKWNKPGSEL
jgi:uncharacterized membrane protein YccF (DUF307 family)